MDRDLCDAALRIAESRGDPSADDLNDLAWALVDPERGDEETDVVRGLRLARAAVAVAPEDTAIQDTLAWALFANGLHDEALAASEQALELAVEEDTRVFQAYLQGMRLMIEEARADDGETDPDDESLRSSQGGADGDGREGEGSLPQLFEEVIR